MGFASSPVIHGNRVLVQCDVQTNAFLAAYEIGTGRELWRTPAGCADLEYPTVIEAGGRTQVAVNGWRETAGYDLQTGKRLWHLNGGGDIPVPTPILAGTS